MRKSTHYIKQGMMLLTVMLFAKTMLSLSSEVACHRITPNGILDLPVTLFSPIQVDPKGAQRQLLHFNIYNYLKLHLFSDFIASCLGSHLGVGVGTSNVIERQCFAKIFPPYFFLGGEDHSNSRRPAGALRLGNLTKKKVAWWGGELLLLPLFTEERIHFLCHYLSHPHRHVFA